MKKRNNVLALVFLFLVVAIIGGYSVANAQEKTVTFAWDEPADLPLIKNWEMRWGNTAGGPYAKLVDIPKDGNYEEPVTVDISGPPATTQTRYFVLKACGDLPQEDGSTKYECSENSNEVSLTVWIPANKFEVPINFRMIAE